MHLIVGVYGIFSVLESNLSAVYPHGKVVCIGDGEFGRAVVASVRLNAREYGSFGIGLLNIAAAAELFVRVGPPYTRVRMTDDPDVSCNADSCTMEMP